MRVTPLEQTFIGVAHGLRFAAADHHLKIHRFKALVDIAMDHPGRAGNAIPLAQSYLAPITVFILDEHGKSALQHEKGFFHLVGMRGVALSGLDIHDRQGMCLGRNYRWIGVLARAASTDEAVLGALEPLDFGILKSVPIGLFVAKPPNVARDHLIQGQIRHLGWHRVTGGGHAVLS